MIVSFRVFYCKRFPIAIGILFLCLWNQGFVIAQNNNDAGLWTTLSIEKELSKKITLSLDEEIRSRENFSTFNECYTEIGGSYKLNKKIKFGIYYRFTEKYKIEEQFSTQHHLILDASLRQKIRFLSLSFRTRLEPGIQNYNSSKKGKVPEWYWRNKLQLKYNVSQRWSIYGGSEIYFQIQDPRNPDDDQGFHRIRYMAGTEFKLNPSNTIGLYYLIQREFDTSFPSNLYIIGLEYSFILPH